MPICDIGNNMIRQSGVQEIVAEMNMPPSSLPPLNNLPQWSRINTLDKARYPKPFLRDRLQPLPHPEVPPGGESRKNSEDSGSDRDLEVSEAMSNPAVRIQHLEKSMNFLRVQHQEILSSLHTEIDRLKRDNKELHFRVVMISKNPASPIESGSKKQGGSSVKGHPSNRNSASRGNREFSAASKASEAKPPLNSSAQEDHNEPSSEQHSQVSDEKLEELKIIFLEEEIKELKKALREEQHKNHYLTQLIETAEQKQIQKQESQTQDSGIFTQRGEIDLSSSSYSVRKSREEASFVLSGDNGAVDNENFPLNEIFIQGTASHLSPRLPMEKTALPAESYKLGVRSQTQPISNMACTERESQQVDKQPTKPVSAGPHQAAPPSADSTHQALRATSAVIMNAATQLPFNATNDPLLVNIANQPPRAPTIPECEIIMRHMQRVNDKQAHELNQLKSDLRDVLYSHKWTPDAYLLAKAYIAEDDAREIEDTGKLPKISMKQPSRKLPDIAYIQKDTVSLPALKQTMGNKAIERRKRTQILQKARLRREITGTNEVGEGC